MKPSDLFLRQPIAAYRLLRFLPTIEPFSDHKDPILSSLIKPMDLSLFSSGDLKHEIIYALYHAEKGNPLPSDLLSTLEERSKNDHQLWPLAARAHVLSSFSRADKARQRLSEQMLPFVLPGDLHPIQIEALAAGDQVLGALHVEWMRKLADLTIEALSLDCNSLGFWFAPMIDVLPEKAFVKALKKLLRRRRMAEGGWGLAAIYAHQLNLNPKPWLNRGDLMDEALYALAAQGFLR